MRYGFSRPGPERTRDNVVEAAIPHDLFHPRLVYPPADVCRGSPAVLQGEAHAEVDTRTGDGAIDLDAGLVVKPKRVDGVVAVGVHGGCAMRERERAAVPLHEGVVGP